MKTTIWLTLVALAFSASAADLKPATARARDEYVSAARKNAATVATWEFISERR